MDGWKVYMGSQYDFNFVDITLILLVNILILGSFNLLG